MKKFLPVVLMAVVLTFASVATAYATSAKTWSSNPDYYSWTTVSDRDGSVLGTVGVNATNPGVHANYQTTTAKCGICHSVHRANAAGVKLLNTATATCAGCHKAGSSTITNVLVSWQTGGPHSSGQDASCNSRGCHLNNPHGAGGSQYKIFAAKLIKSAVDVAVAPALVDPIASGITVADLNADATSVWDAKVRSAVVVGYTCNTAGCHVQTMLTVLKKGYSEDRLKTYGSVTDTSSVAKTGHMTVAAANEASGSYAAVTSCTSCHDQTDSASRSGFTFPHSETAFGTSNVTASGEATRAYLWMTVADSVTGAKTGMLATNNKAFDGACLKCHRDGAGNGIGLTK